ncbi:MAG: cytochrome c biogenesis protein CcsA [Anaerolineae bacterium]|nr:cytochrome c biogenesis protein CcsA [Anaerolineae bacterium]MDW8171799.1 cytochrome c biogenesis protein CcsA [Anaerolineae bacterium]
MSAVHPLPAESDKLKNDSRSRILPIYTVVTVVLALVTIIMWLFYAGTDVQQGNIQRIFYLHMSSFFCAFLAFGATVLGGVQYLRTRDPKWDTLALAGVEVGVIFAFINLATGSIWARPIWNTWWTWDPRLTSAAVMVLTYIAYLMLRRGIENVETRRRFASIYGILAITTVIFTLIVIRIRPDTIHPAVIGPSAANASGEFEVTAGIGATLGATLFVWTVFVTPTLINWRIRLENATQRLEQLKAQYMEK